MAWYFLGQFSRISDGHPYPFYPEVPPRRLSTRYVHPHVSILLHAGDLFDMLLPMLSIYQEYVRNHHYSLQVLRPILRYYYMVTLYLSGQAGPTSQFLNGTHEL